jgi:hypothetical protein
LDTPLYLANCYPPTVDLWLLTMASKLHRIDSVKW